MLEEVYDIGGLDRDNNSMFLINVYLVKAEQDKDTSL
jgi:hypothetical protein